MMLDEKVKCAMNDIIELSNQGEAGQVYSLIDGMLNIYNRKELLDLLFDMWKNKHKEDNNWQNNFPKSKGKSPEENEFKHSFCKDGFIFDNNECEILFICRESNVDGKAEENDTFWIKEIMSLSDGEYFGKDPKPKDKRMQTRYKNYLKEAAGTLECNIEKCAYMNVNKRGGYGNCDGKRLNQYAEDYMGYILAEIRIINPQIIIFLGKAKEKDKYVAEIMKNLNEKICFQVEHPSRASYDNMKDDLKNQK